MKIVSLARGAAFCALLWLVSACLPVSPAPPQSGSGPGQAAAAPRRGGQIVYAVTGSDVRILNPILHSDAVSGAVVDRIFDPLISADPRTGAPVPALATSWDIAPDGLAYTFHLRPGVVFHDDQPFTAEDVKFTFDVLKTNRVSTVRKANVEKIKSIDVLDSLTVRFNLSESYCPFMEDIRLGILPKHLLEHSPNLNEDAFNQHPIGTGRFAFVEWVKDDHITLRAFDRHWRGRPNLDRWIFRPLKDRAALLAGLKTGEVDLAPIEASELADVEGQSNLQVFKYYAPNLTYLAYNTRRPGLDDQRVRQALDHALDRQLIIDKVLLGQGRPVDSDQPPDSWAYSANVPRYDYDPDTARQMLDAAGWAPGPDGVRQKGGQRMQYSLATNSGTATREAIVTIAQQQFKDVGVAVELQFQDFASFINRINKLDFDMFVSGFSFGVDPDNYELWHSSQQPDTASGKEGFNRAGFSTPQLDALLEQGRSQPGCDQARRKEIYAETQRIVAEGAPWSFLHQTRSLIAANSKIVGIDPTPYGGVFYNLEQWSVQ